MSYLYAVLAAALFGASTPVAKTLLSGLPPFMLAALCYLGSGLAIAAWKLASGALRAPGRPGEPALALKDWPYVAGFILSGGVLAPVLLLKGLALTTSSGASVILNLELIFTSLIAWAVFKEHTGPRFWLAAALVAAGAVLLSVTPGEFSLTFGKGPVFVALAALLWGVDNNLTAKLSIKDPAAIALIKGLTGGAINLMLAARAGEFFWDPALWLPGLALGAVAYGAGLVLFIMAMRGLGAARAGAFFGTYPFFGVVLSVIFLGEPVTLSLAAAFVLMTAAFYLIISERHGHRHTHELLPHEHLHSHDDAHHAHPHAEGEAVPEHSHAHTHAEISHAHPHTPDSHHRHVH